MLTRVILLLIAVVVIVGLLGFGIGVSMAGNRELGGNIMVVVFVIGLLALVLG